ncbi:MAG: dihydropteroate synthase [Candidatus Eisenbacteria bacterium]|nr:dihydropteroate synthase [Candidatus Eisenbacteria bacterium]
MGVLNVTPDSFSDGGRYLDPGRAMDQLHRLADQGAHIIDVGGESTRPGSDPVPAAEQWRRIGPLLKRAAREGPGCLLSVDTTDPAVAGRALECGVAVINDISALRGSRETARLAAESGAGLILMHMAGTPKTMQRDPRYADLLGEVRGELQRSLEAACELGVAREQIVCDPGIGFGKTLEHNLELIDGIPALAPLGRPLLVGASRKGFIGRIVGEPVGRRLEGSLAAHVAAALAGAHMVRVHDVGPTVRAMKVVDAVLGRRTASVQEGDAP